MPILTTCPDHPDAVVNYPDEIMFHAESEHPGVNAQSVFDGLVRRFVSQAHAQGRNELRIIHCRSCGQRFAVTVPPGDDGADVPTECEECSG